MTKKTRYELYVLGVLLVLAVVAYSSQSRNSVFTGASASDVRFTPLDVSDPSLRLDLLDRIQKLEYKGQHRNIFSAEPLPPPPSVLAAQQARARGPVVPPPPPVTVPATFYGIVTDLRTGQKRACFSANADDVYIVPVGGTLLNQFRILTIGNNSVEVEEISSGRHTTLMLAQPAGGPSQPPQQGQS